ncbi:MAG: sulfatase-like hydrolase/transferase [Nitrospirota bacterium]|nr:MAG: sulfatase-like hydrolase/transferase [Nitrospirota bacterium]
MISDKIRKITTKDPFFLSFSAFVAFNTVISCILSFPLLRYASMNSFFSAFTTLIPFIANYFLLNLVVGLIIYLPSRLMNGKYSLLLMTAAFSLFHAFILIDVRIYTIFRFHINSLVINVISTEGAGDSVALGAGTYISFLIKMIVIISTNVIALSFIRKKISSWDLKYLTIFKRYLITVIWVLISLVVTDKLMFAYGDLFNKITITKNAKLFTLYQPFTMKQFAADVLKINVNREDSITMPLESSTLNYPKEDLKFDPARNKGWNILIIVIDGLRFDMLNKDTMPNLWEYSKNNLYYKNHYSGGNGTRFGIFSILYGIHGSYWHNFLAQRRSAVIIDSLIDLDYDFKILSSTRLTFPEFRKTAFIKIPEHIEDNFPGLDTVSRDLTITNRLTDFISTRKRDRPFFGFVFFDAPHQPYHFPSTMEKYSPVSSTKIIYFKDIGKGNIHLLKNRYQNAIFYNDSLIKRIISSLEDNGIADNTLIIITGDHGEEFYENGHFGHTSAFNDYQLKTPLIMHLPGKGPGTINRLTSHLDIVPTVMNIIGFSNPESAYSQGTSLLSSGPVRYITASKWDKSAIIDSDNIISFSTETYNLGSIEVRNRHDYSQVEDHRILIKEKRKLMVDVSIRMSEFYK